ncbi:MAG: acyltransferase [Actinobacteria bacterium]|nr:acyltransferase [Actinomycetota bacterium]
MKEHQPALDGVRAIAVLLVVLFHLGLPWMGAGYLGVSVFFTLSGFLITSLLLRAPVPLRQFYARRARRLLPASTAVLAAVLLAHRHGEFALVPNLRAELFGSLFQVANWVQLAGGSSYAGLFGRSAMFTSPLEHFWSLAIEEQFYLLWPIALAVLRRRRYAVYMVTICFAVAAPLIAWRWGADAAYWSTPSRLPELLVGCSAAVWLQRRPTLSPNVRWLAPPAVLTIVACSALFPSDAGPAFSGWLSPFALVSVALLIGLQVPGPVRTLLSVRPLVWLGTVSYGLYLVHWPVFVLLRQHGWDLAQWRGALVAVGLTLALTVASYWLLERPIRRATWSAAATGRFAMVAVGAVLVGVVAMPVSRGFLEADTSTLQAAAIDVSQPMTALRTVSPSTSTSTSTTVAVASEPPVPHEVVLPVPPTPARPVRVMVVGDSTAFYVGQGLAGWAVQHPQHAQVDLTWCQGCGAILDGTITSFDAESFVATSRSVLQETLPEQIERVHPDVVMLMITVNDVADRSWDMGEGVLTPRDERYRMRMYSQYRSLTDSLLAMGVPTVVWTIPPVPTTEFEARDLREADRYERQHDVIRQVAADVVPPVGAAVVLCEMDDWLRTAGHSGDVGWRPDGTHLTEQSAGWLVDRWLGPWIVGVAVG